MIVGSTKEDLTQEKRVSLTPEAAKSILGLGCKVYLQKDYGSHLGIKDKEYSNLLKKRTIDLIEEKGFHEYYSCINGNVMGANNFSWSASFGRSLS